MTLNGRVTAAEPERIAIARPMTPTRCGALRWHSVPAPIRVGVDRTQASRRTVKRQEARARGASETVRQDYRKLPAGTRPRLPLAAPLATSSPTFPDTRG